MYSSLVCFYFSEHPLQLHECFSCFPLCCRTRPVFRLWRAMPRTSPVSASIQNCLSSSLDQKMVRGHPACSRSAAHQHHLQHTLSNDCCICYCVGTVRIWHSSTYRLESTLNYGMERVWCVCGLRGSNNVALGYDEGSIIIKVRV